jgi:hypothetical protein
MGTFKVSALKHSPFYALAVMFGKKVLLGVAILLTKLSTM